MRQDSAKTVGFVAILDLVFVAFLIVSGLFTGILSTVFYMFAFITPVFLGFYATRENNKDKNFLEVKGVLPSLPVIAPTIGLVMIISALTSYVIGVLTDKSNVVELGDNLALALLTHAVMPAILEEALFRYIPLRAFKEERWLPAILYSALFFSLIHHSFFSMPYAFIAGAIFMFIDLAFDSVWPSVIIHFLNNALSVLFIFYNGDSAFATVAILVLVLLSIASIIYIAVRIEKYKKLTEKITDVSELGKNAPTEVYVLAIPMLLIAVMELIQ